MRKILKRFGVGMLVMSLALTLPPNYSINIKKASADGITGGGNSNNPGGGSHVSGTATVTGYGFRVSLRDIRKLDRNNDHQGKLWTLKSGKEGTSTAKYEMKHGESNYKNKLEWDTKNGLYLGLSKSDKNLIYSETSNGYKTVDDDRIFTDTQFNKMPGMKNYSSSNLKGTNIHDKVNWKPYAKKFNLISTQMDKDNGKGAQEVINWFNNKGLLGSGKSHFLAEKTIVVVEPFIIWTSTSGGKKTNRLFTFQSAILHTGNPQATIFNKVYGSAGGINLAKVKKTSGGKDYYNPNTASGAQHAAIRVAALGGFYQKGVKKNNDCTGTKIYDETSGYGCYGTKHTDDNSEIRASANVSLVYNGGYNFNKLTQAASTNTKTYRTVRLKGEKNGKSISKKLKVSDGEESWKNTSGDNTRENLGFPSDYHSAEYATIFSGTFLYNPKNDKKSYKRLYNCSNVTSKMKDEENGNPASVSENNKLVLRWGKRSVSKSLESGDSNVYCYGDGAEINSLKFRTHNDFYSDTEPIAMYINSKLADSDDMTRRNAIDGNNKPVKNRKFKTTEKNSIDYAKGCLADAFDAKAKTQAGEKVEVSTDFTEDSGVKKGSKFGLSVQLLAKNKEVDNPVVTYHIDKNGNVTKSASNKKHWQIVSVKGSKQKYYSTIKTNGSAVYLIAVPNYDTTKSWSSSVDSGLSSKLIADTSGITDATALCSKYVSNFREYFADADGVLKDSEGNTLIENADVANKEFRFGSVGKTVRNLDSSNKSEIVNKTPEDDELYGYSVYILEVEDPEGDPGDTTGGLTLKDYEINHVFRSMCEEASNSGNMIAVTLRSVETVDLHEKKSACSQGSYWYPFPTADSYKVTITEKGSTGKTITKDNKLSGTKMLLAYDSLFHFDTRTNLLAGRVFDSREYHKVDYAFNLSRGVFGDKRTVSAISDQKIDETFAQEVLDLQYGDIPQTTEEASSTRESNATVGSKITDKFKFDAIYTATGSKTKYTKIYNASHTDWFGSGENSWWSTHSCEKVQEHSNELVAFKLLKGTAPGISTDVAKVTITIESIANKYQTETNEVGTNTEVSDSKYLSDALQKPKTGSNGMTENLTIGSEKTGYATAYVKNSDTVLSFYPEVPMQAMEYSGDSITGTDSVAIKRVLTMGEENRKAKSSSLYLFTIKKDKSSGEEDDDLSGTTYSDTAVGGSKASKISDMVTLTAGGDFGVAVKETGFSLNLYGYSMDVINSETDESMKIAQSGVKDMISGVENTDDVSIDYSDIVKNDYDVYSDWDNDSNSEAMRTEFKTWVTAMLKPENFKADMEMQLYKGGTDSTDRLRGSSVTNFNTTIGKLSEGEEDEEDMTFPLAVRHGEICKWNVDENGNIQTGTYDTNYEKFISQLADDYGLGDGDGTTRFEKAEKLFKASGLYTSKIIKKSACIQKKYMIE